MERELEVLLSRGATNVVVGRLWARARGGNETASFEYAANWLREGFELDPELPLGRGQFPHRAPARHHETPARSHGLGIRARGPRRGACTEVIPRHPPTALRSSEAASAAATPGR
jgi:hypothetical protein